MVKLTGNIVKSVPIGKGDNIKVKELKENLKVFGIEVREVEVEGGLNSTLVELSKDNVSVYLDSLTNQKRWG